MPSPNSLSSTSFKTFSLNDALTKMLKIDWAPPEYKQGETLPWIPEEKELDALIGSSRSQRMTAFLQTLKETFADPGEVLKLRWIDVNAEKTP